MVTALSAAQVPAQAQQVSTALSADQARSLRLGWRPQSDGGAGRMVPPKVRDALARAKDPSEFLEIAYGLSREEAQTRLDRQQRALDLSATLMRRFPALYGGMWIDNAAGGRVRAALVSRHPAVLQALKASPIGSSIDVVDVPFSLAELTAVADRMRAERNALAHPASRPVSPSASARPRAKVNIYLPGATEQQKQGIVAHFGPAVQVLDESLTTRGDGEACTLQACNDVPRLRGAIGATNVATGRTASFCCNVRSSVTEKWYQLVAGHTVHGPSQEYAHNGHRVGFVTGSVDDGALDSGRVYIYPEEEAYWRDAFGNPSRWFVGVFGDAMAFHGINLAPGATIIGTVLCRSGVGSGHKCGEILQTDANPVGNDNNLLMTSACSEPGDSGGPHYTASPHNGYQGGILFGMHVTSQVDGCPTTGDRAFAVHIYFQTIYHKVQVVNS